MRLEIIIRDSTRPDLKARLTGLTRLLSARPELVEEILFNGDPEAVYRVTETAIRIVRVFHTGKIGKTR